MKGGSTGNLKNHLKRNHPSKISHEGKGDNQVNTLDNFIQHLPVSIILYVKIKNITIFEYYIF
jgi:hypothetical protein